MDRVYHIGSLHIQFNWDWQGWYYTNQKNEQINLNFYIGTVQPPERDCKLYQVVVGPFMANWAWR